MAGKLIMRVVRDDQLERVSIYLRPGGTYQYVEEWLSEWDNSPASWIERQPSGIFSSAKDAMAEAKLAVGWMRCPSGKGRDWHEGEGAPPKNWREVGVAERALLMHLLQREFDGRTAILEQLKSVEVMRVSPQGSLKLRTRGPFAEVQDSDSPSPRPNHRILVQGFYDDAIDESQSIIRIAALVRLAVHVTEGRLSELEVYKENGKPILLDPYEVELSRVHLY